MKGAYPWSKATLDLDYVARMLTAVTDDRMFSCARDGGNGGSRR
jgi:hypothetical protein